MKPALQLLVDRTVALARSTFNRSDQPLVVVSPYRMNPLGAHIDHQGGSVLARTIDQYSVIAFFPRVDSLVRLHCDLPETAGPTIEFLLNDAAELISSSPVWASYVMGAACVAQNDMDAHVGVDAVVTGTLPSSGLSSSASVVLAYLHAFAFASNNKPSKQDYVEMVRRVENDYVGLANGIQDQMSIVFGERNSLSLLHMDSVSADQLSNPANKDELTWVLCYSGFSRELVSSGFNTRVSECREAAGLLFEGAQHLGEVPKEARDVCVEQRNLPPHLQRRVSHVYGEMDRVAAGAKAWCAGDAIGFGKLMNQSCQSSIDYYECGTQPMIDLHQFSKQIEGVYGSRFGGGGYGGCLIVLAQASMQQSVIDTLQQQYLEKYPDKRSIARFFVAHAESHVRLL